MPNPLRTTAFRWSAGIALWSTLLAALLFGFLYWRTAALGQAQLEEQIRHELAFAGEDVSLTRQRIETWLGEDLHGVRFAGLFAQDGRPQAGNLDAVPSGLPLDGSIHRLATVVRLQGREVDDQLWAGGARLGDGRTLVVAHDTDAVDRLKATVVDALMLALGPTLALSIVGGVTLATRARRRVVAVDAALARLMHGDLRQRLPLAGTHDEFDRLACNVNEMLAEIERLVQQVKGVGDAIAHDLRTPLTRLRTGLERGRETARSADEFRDLIDRSLAWLDGALALITAVLRIGEIEHGQRRSAFAPTDLGDVVGAVAELYEPLADEKGLAFSVHVARDLPPVMGDRDLLCEALANLVDNAVKFTPAGGAVRLTVTERDALVVASVEDAGPGISPEDRERVFDRFYRAEPARSSPGHGLGLGLVAAIADLHGFALSVDAGEAGGARFDIAARASGRRAGTGRTGVEQTT